MKKIIVLIVFIVSAVCAYSQSDSTVCAATDRESCLCNQSQQPVLPKLSDEAYKNTPEWGKYKALRAVGWTTFGVGMTATLSGGFLYLLLSNLSGNGEAGTIVFFSGVGLTAASVPMLVCAYRYRSKAKKIGLNMGVTQISTPTFGQNLSYTPALGISISF